jgi:nucleotide-binding universal stress UspA family protein
VQSALPFLKDAETVRLCLFNPRGAREGEDVQGMAALANYLQRHGVPVETPLILDAADGPERAILSELDAFSADLLIMGAYSRTRFQEIVFGGMTATIVREARVPVLLTH